MDRVAIVILVPMTIASRKLDQHEMLDALHSPLEELAGCRPPEVALARAIKQLRHRQLPLERSAAEHWRQPRRLHLGGETLGRAYQGRLRTLNALQGSHGLVEVSPASNDARQDVASAGIRRYSVTTSKSYFVPLTRHYYVKERSGLPLLESLHLLWLVGQLPRF